MLSCVIDVASFQYPYIGLYKQIAESLDSKSCRNQNYGKHFFVSKDSTKNSLKP